MMLPPPPLLPITHQPIPYSTHANQPTNQHNHSVVDPSDRFNFYKGLLKLQYCADPGKVCNFLKVRRGSIFLCGVLF